MRHIEMGGIGESHGANNSHSFQRAGIEPPSLPQRIVSIDRSMPPPLNNPVISPQRITQEPGLSGRPPVRALPQSEPRRVSEVSMIQVSTGDDGSGNVPRDFGPVPPEPPRSGLPGREDLIFIEGDGGPEFAERDEYSLLSAQEVQRRMGVSEDELYLMVMQKQVLTVFGDELTFPDLQFSDTGTVLPGVARVVQDIENFGKERDMAPLSKDIADVLSTRVDALDGKTILQAATEDAASDTVGAIAREILTTIEHKNAHDFLQRYGMEPSDTTSMTNISDTPVLDVTVQAFHGRLTEGATIGLDTYIGNMILWENGKSQEKITGHAAFTTIPYGLMSEAHVMNTLGVDKETLDARIRRHELLAYDTRDGWVFPDTQFIPDGDSMRVVPGLSRVLLNLLESPDSTTENPHLKSPRWAVGKELHTVPAYGTSYGKSIMDVLHAESDAEFLITFPDDVYSGLSEAIRTAQRTFPVASIRGLLAQSQQEDRIMQGQGEINVVETQPGNPFESVLAELRAVSVEILRGGDDQEWDRIAALMEGIQRSLADDAGPSENLNEQIAWLGQEFRSRIALLVDNPVVPVYLARGDAASPVATQTYRDGTNRDEITYIGFKPERVGDTEWGDFDFTPTHALRIQEQAPSSEPQWGSTFAVRDDGGIVRHSFYSGISDDVTPHVTRELNIPERVALLNYITAPHLSSEDFAMAMQINTVDRENLMSVWGLTAQQVDQIANQFR